MVKLNSLQEWNSLYSEGKHLSIWPWSDLVSYVRRYATISNGKKIKILELGCGAGANIPFLTSLNAEYYGIDGSNYIIKKLKKQYPKLKNRLISLDFTKKIPYKQQFDIVVDRASLTHNTTYAIKKCLNLVHSKMKPGGIHIGIDWFSTLHSDYTIGKFIKKNDLFTKTGFLSGQFIGVGKVHFSDKKHLLDLFKKYNINILEQKIIKSEIPKSNQVFSSWNLLATKND